MEEESQLVWFLFDLLESLPPREIAFHLVLSFRAPPTHFHYLLSMAIIAKEMGSCVD